RVARAAAGLDEVATQAGRATTSRARSPAELQMSRRPCLVESPDGRGDGRLVQELGVLVRLAVGTAEPLGERVERLHRLGLRRLDHQRLLDDQREVDRRWVVAEVD